MHRSRLGVRLALATSLVLVSLAAPAGASPLPPPTASQILNPSSPTFVTYDAANPGSLHVDGTTTGGTGAVDLVCYAGSAFHLVASGVSAASNAFSTDIPLTDALLDGLGSAFGYCVLRAVPTGTTPPAPPDQQSPFEGPAISWGVDRPYTLGQFGPPNPPDQKWDYLIKHPQSRAYNDYYTAASCGLCDTYLYDPVTLAVSNPIWWANAGLYFKIPYNSVQRSTVQVDGVNVYAAGGLTGTLRNNPGFPMISYSRSVDPLTGDMEILETDSFVPCAPDPAAYPPVDATCPGFGAANVTLNRSILQNHDGRQVTIVDSWESTDAQPHELDVAYDDSNYDTNWAQAGHGSLYDFTWTPTPGFKPYADGTEIAPPAGGPVTMYVQSDATTPAGGDAKNPFGALTYGTPPCALHLERVPSLAHGGGADWHARYKATIPAAGDLVITQVYSHDYSLAAVQALAHDAEQALPTVSDTPEPCPLNPPSPPSGGSGSTTPPPATTSGSTQTTPAAPAGVPPAPSAVPPSPKCRVPNLRGRTLRGAKRLLRRAHCRLGTVRRVQSARVRPGRVLKTTPRAGTMRRPGARITVRVARAAS